LQPSAIRQNAQLSNFTSSVNIFTDNADVNGYYRVKRDQSYAYIYIYIYIYIHIHLCFDAQLLHNKRAISREKKKKERKLLLTLQVNIII